MFGFLVFSTKKKENKKMYSISHNMFICVLFLLIYLCLFQFDVLIILLMIVYIYMCLLILCSIKLLINVLMILICFSLFDLIDMLLIGFIIPDF